MVLSAQPHTPTPAPSTAAAAATAVHGGYDESSEPIHAYLRLRPPPDPSHNVPFLRAAEDERTVNVLPRDASDNTAVRYTFTRVLDETSNQSDIYRAVALPLVRAILRKNEDALLFAHGATNSGKTYTIQGCRGEPGLLPRVIFALLRATRDCRCEMALRPTGFGEARLVGEFDRADRISSSRLDVADLQAQLEADYAAIDLAPSADKSDTAPDRMSTGSSDYDSDDDGDTFALWASYAEIYQERVYDLLAAPMGRQNDGNGKRITLTVKRDRRTGHRYVYGLREIRICDLRDAVAVLALGQRTRRAAATKLNATSSRSHALFTLKLIRVRAGAQLAELAGEAVRRNVHVSRFSVVDLAGSERAARTQTTGTRLREAGTINGSLMVLGQCMEQLRSRAKSRAQQQSLVANDGDNGKSEHMTPLPSANGSAVKTSHISYRDSRLTELFQYALEGAGDATAGGVHIAMLVTANAHDGSHAETNHVLRFSACAREVTVRTIRRRQPSVSPWIKNRIRAVEKNGTAVTNATTATISKTTDTPENSDTPTKAPGKRAAKEASAAAATVSIDHANDGNKTVSATSGDETGDEFDTEELSAYIGELCRQNEELRARWLEAESRSALVEARIREEISEEMAVQLHAQEQRFLARLMVESDAGEAKSERKLSILERKSASNSESPTADSAAQPPTRELGHSHYRRSHRRVSSNPPSLQTDNSTANGSDDNDDIDEETLLTVTRREYAALEASVSQLRAAALAQRAVVRKQGDELAMLRNLRATDSAALAEAEHAARMAERTAHEAREQQSTTTRSHGSERRALHAAVTRRDREISELRSRLAHALENVAQEKARNKPLPAEPVSSDSVGSFGHINGNNGGTTTAPAVARANVAGDHLVPTKPPAESSLPNIRSPPANIAGSSNAGGGGFGRRLIDSVRRLATPKQRRALDIFDSNSNSPCPPSRQPNTPTRTNSSVAISRKLKQSNRSKTPRVVDSDDDDDDEYNENSDDDSMATAKRGGRRLITSPLALRNRKAGDIAKGRTDSCVDLTENPTATHEPTRNKGTKRKAANDSATVPENKSVSRVRGKPKAKSGAKLTQKAPGPASNTTPIARRLRSRRRPAAA